MRRIALIRALTLIVLAMLASLSVGIMYVSDFYPAALPPNLANDHPSVTILNTRTEQVITPRKPKAALIFYPGGKVEHTAYAPLMAQLAEQGILCIVPKMPFNLAVLNINAAEDYLSDYPEIKHWYIGGHSLGGSMAANYAAGASKALEGIVLLGSYSATDISQSGMKVLSVYGSRDKVLNFDSYEENKPKLPVGFREIILEGGNHAGFGSYGNQKGDGEASISREQQWKATAEAIAQFCKLGTSL